MSLYSLIKQFFTSPRKEIWVQDSFSNSTSFRPHSEMPILVTEKLLKSLERKSSKFGEVRFCLHQSAMKKTHVMFIKKPKVMPLKIKSHPEYGKYIHLIRGKVLVAIYDNQGGLVQNFHLNSKAFAVYIPAGNFHSCSASTRNAIVLECVAGPFDRSSSNLFLPTSD